jgi:hypothetical protein
MQMMGGGDFAIVPGIILGVTGDLDLRILGGLVGRDLLCAEQEKCRNVRLGDLTFSKSLKPGADKSKNLAFPVETYQVGGE